MHIPPFDNGNKPIVDTGDATVPLNYFNIVKLKKGEAFTYQVPGYETCIVPATGTVDVDIEGVAFSALGGRGEDVWDGEPQGVYVPVGAKATMVCVSDDTEVFVAGAAFDKVLEPFDVREHDLVQYGSDDTKTHRKIKHILGQKQADKVAQGKTVDEIIKERVARQGNMSRGEKTVAVLFFLLALAWITRPLVGKALPGLLEGRLHLWL